MGLAIGHELTHGFDNKGSQIDKNGNVKNWWQPETRDRYTEKAKCIERQYSNYTVAQINKTVCYHKVFYALVF